MYYTFAPYRVGYLKHGWVLFSGRGVSFSFDFGDNCLARFAGVEARKRESNELESSTRQVKVLHDAECVSEFLQEGAAVLDRFGAKARPP